MIYPERGAVLERGLAGEPLEMLDKPVPAQPARLRARFDGHRAAQLRFHLRSDFQNLHIDGALQLLYFGAAARDLRQQPGQFGGRSGQVVRLLTLHFPDHPVESRRDSQVGVELERVQVVQPQPVQQRRDGVTGEVHPIGGADRFGRPPVILRLARPVQHDAAGVQDGFGAARPDVQAAGRDNQQVRVRPAVRPTARGVRAVVLKSAADDGQLWVRRQVIRCDVRVLIHGRFPPVP